MEPNSSSTPPSSLAQNLLARAERHQPEPEMEIWEAPFERWIRLADILLEDSLPNRRQGCHARPC